MAVGGVTADAEGAGGVLEAVAMTARRLVAEAIRSGSESVGRKGVPKASEGASR